MTSMRAGVLGTSRHLPHRRAAVSRTVVHAFYLGLTLGLIGMVAAGFWPSYFGPLASGGVARPWIIHLHGAVFSGWMALLLLQVVLASTGRVRLHRRVGELGIWFGGLVLMVGVMVSFAAPVIHMRAGEWTGDRAAGFLLLPLVDMVLFAGFFGAAVAYRRQPEIHKRLILAATVSLAFAAAIRMPIDPPLLKCVVWLSPMLAAMVFDVISRGRVHPLNAVSTVVLAIAFARIPYQQSEGWIPIGRVLLAPFL